MSFGSGDSDSGHVLLLDRRTCPLWLAVTADSNGIVGSISIEVDPTQHDLFRISLKQLGRQSNLEVAILERDLAVAAGDADFGIIGTHFVER